MTANDKHKMIVDLQSSNLVIKFNVGAWSGGAKVVDQRSLDREALLHIRRPLNAQR